MTPADQVEAAARAAAEAGLAELARLGFRLPTPLETDAVDAATDLAERVRHAFAQILGAELRVDARKLTIVDERPTGRPMDGPPPKADLGQS